MRSLAHDEPGGRLKEIIGRRVCRIVVIRRGPDRFDRFKPFERIFNDRAFIDHEGQLPHVVAILTFNLDVNLRPAEKPVVFHRYAEQVLHLVPLERCGNFLDLLPVIAAAFGYDANPLARHFFGGRLGRAPILRPLRKLGEVRVSHEAEPAERRVRIVVNWTERSIHRERVGRLRSHPRRQYRRLDFNFRLL